MIDDLNRALFEKHIGQRFQVTNEAGVSSELKLDRVRECIAKKETPGAPKLDTFSVVFTTQSDTKLGQGLYTVSHPEMGAVEGLFMVPIVGAQPGACDYEVLFSRIVSE